MAQQLAEPFSQLSLNPKAYSLTSSRLRRSSYPDSQRSSNDSGYATSSSNFDTPKLPVIRPAEVSLFHVAPIVLGAPSIGDTCEQEPKVRITLDAVPSDVLELFWSVTPAKNGATVAVLNAALSRLLTEPISDYGWAVQTYYALLELYDSLWAQFVVSAGCEPPRPGPGTDLEEWKQAMLTTIQLIPQAILRLEAYANPFGLGPLACIKKSRVSSYQQDHPYRVIEKYLRFGECKSEESSKL